MKMIATTVLLFAVLIAPMSLHAASTEALYRTTLLELIDVLREQIRVLTSTLEERQSRATVSIPTPRQSIASVNDISHSQFYDGEYRALYATKGTDLIPLGATKLQSLHAQLWNRFVALMGADFVAEQMQEFRVYSSQTSEYDAFAERDPVRGNWILGVNTYDLNLSRASVAREMDRLFLHEIGHIILDEDRDILESFIATYWGSSEHEHASRVALMEYGPLRDDVIANYYETHIYNFVSEYAATSALEDAVESFVVFVTKGYQQGNYERDDKVNFFFNYPELVEMRANIQEILAL